MHPDTKRPSERQTHEGDRQVINSNVQAQSSRDSIMPETTRNVKRTAPIRSAKSPTTTEVQQTATPTLEISSFLSALGLSEHVSLYALDDSGSKGGFVVPVSDIDTVNARGNGIFYVANDTVENRTRQPNNADIKSGRILFADFDGQQFESGEAVVSYVGQAIGIEPSIVIETSQHNYHALLVLESAVTIEEWQQLENALLMKLPKADQAVKNPARLLRLPGTKNMKPGKDGFRSVVVRKSKAGYTLSEIRELLKAPVLDDVYETLEESESDLGEAFGIVAPLVRAADGTINTTVLEVSLQLGSALIPYEVAEKAVVNALQTNSNVSEYSRHVETFKRGYYRGLESPNKDAAKSKGFKPDPVQYAMDVVRAFYSGELWVNEYGLKVMMGNDVLTNPDNMYMKVRDDHSIRLQKATAKDATLYVAEENRKNPPKDYILSVYEEHGSNGLEDLKTLATKRMGVDGSVLTYADAMVEKALLRVVMRVMLPGVKADDVLILIGKQGDGKTTWLRSLIPGYALSFSGDIENKDSLQLLSSNAVAIMDEVAYLFGKTKVEKMKEFLSAEEDKFRLPYDRDTVDFKRRCAFFAASNDDDILADTTGNRRFHIVKIGTTAEFDVAWLVDNSPRLLAAAYHRVKTEIIDKGVDPFKMKASDAFHWFDAQDQVAYQKINFALFQKTDNVADAILDYLSENEYPEQIASKVIYEHLASEGMELRQQDPKDSARVGRAMELGGYSKKTVTLSKGSYRGKKGYKLIEAPKRLDNAVSIAESDSFFGSFKFRHGDIIKFSNGVDFNYGAVTDLLVEPLNRDKRYYLVSLLNEKTVKYDAEDLEAKAYTIDDEAYGRAIAQMEVNNVNQCVMKKTGGKRTL